MTANSIPGDEIVKLRSLRAPSRLMIHSDPQPGGQGKNVMNVDHRFIAYLIQNFTVEELLTNMLEITALQVQSFDERSKHNHPFKALSYVVDELIESITPKNIVNRYNFDNQMRNKRGAELHIAWIDKMVGDDGQMMNEILSNWIMNFAFKRMKKLDSLKILYCAQILKMEGMDKHGNIEVPDAKDVWAGDTFWPLGLRWSENSSRDYTTFKGKVNVPFEDVHPFDMVDVSSLGFHTGKRNEQHFIKSITFRTYCMLIVMYFKCLAQYARHTNKVIHLSAIDLTALSLINSGLIPTNTTDYRATWYWEPREGERRFKGWNYIDVKYKIEGDDCCLFESMSEADKKSLEAVQDRVRRIVRDVKPEGDGMMEFFDLYQSSDVLIRKQREAHMGGHDK